MNRLVKHEKVSKYLFMEKKTGITMQESDCVFRARFYQGIKYFFVLSLLKYATKDSTLAEDVDTSQAPEKDLLEKEKATLKKLLPLVEKFVHEKSTLQVSWFVSCSSPPSTLWLVS